MAKLGNYYGLCPLIDHKSLLGVTQDSEAGHVIVTLGKNICIKYRIADQKQIHSWRTKDKFSSAVIYDFGSLKYAAAFNSSYIRIWNDGEENIDKLKKYKFTKQIHSLIQCAKQTFVIFKDLSVSELSKALEVRKELAKETKDVDIVDVLYCSRSDEVYIGIIITNQENLIFEWSLFIDGSFHYKGRESLNVRKNVELVGYVMCHLAIEGSIQLLTLWSDGHMYANQLTPTIQEDELKSNTNLLGKRFAILQSLSLKSPVSMIPLNHQYIALYGANRSEEGAVLLLYNTQFKVTQSKVSFKLFTSGSKLWRVENNLLLGMGQNLAVIPYHLHDEKLATLIGSHNETFAENSNHLESDVTIVDKVQLLDWDTFTIDNKKDVILNGVSHKRIPESIEFKIDQLLEKGRPEAAVCSELLSQIIEERNVDAILDTIDYFMDIPEEFISKLLEFGLTVDAKAFRNNKRSENLPENLQPVGRHLFLEKILILRFSDILLLPYLRRNFSIDAVLSLLSYIQCIFSHEDYCLPNMDFVESEKKLIEWTSLLLDAKYQNILLSQDESVLKLLKSLSEIVEEHLNNLKGLDKLYPELEKIRARKGNENVRSSSLFYCVEKMSLY